MEHKQHEKNDEEAQETPEAPRDHYLDGDPEKDAETLARVGPEDTVFVRGRISTDIEAIDDLTCARLYVHSRVTVDGLYNAQVDQLTVSGVVQDVYRLSGNSTVSPDTDLTASGRHRAFVKITEYGMIRSLVNSAVSSLAGTGGAGATARVFAASLQARLRGAGLGPPGTVLRSRKRPRRSEPWPSRKQDTTTTTR